MQVTLIDKMGDDLTVVNAARVSYSKVSKTFSTQDERLIKYLADHEHWSPFAHAFLQFRIKAPVFQRALETVRDAEQQKKEKIQKNTQALIQQVQCK